MGPELVQRDDGAHHRPAAPEAQLGAPATFRGILPVTVFANSCQATDLHYEKHPITKLTYVRNIKKLTCTFVELTRLSELFFIIFCDPYLEPKNYERAWLASVRLS